MTRERMEGLDVNLGFVIGFDKQRNNFYLYEGTLTEYKNKEYLVRPLRYDNFSEKDVLKWVAGLYTGYGGENFVKVFTMNDVPNERLEGMLDCLNTMNYRGHARIAPADAFKELGDAAESLLEGVGKKETPEAQK